MAIVLNHSKAEGTAKVVLLGIANHDGDGGAWPSIDTLCRYANKNRRTVQEAIEQLSTPVGNETKKHRRGLGELKVEHNAGGNSATRADRRPNRYEILLSCPARCDGTRQHRDRDGVRSTAPEPSLNHPQPRESSLAAFALDDQLRAWATNTCPGIDVDGETATWLDWRAANGKTYKDERAAWKLWMRRARSAPAHEPPAPGPARPRLVSYCPTCELMEFDCRCNDVEDVA